MIRKDEEQGTVKRTYTVKEIASILRIGKDEAYKLCREKVFQTVRVGDRWIISKQSFDKWLDIGN